MANKVLEFGGKLFAKIGSFIESAGAVAVGESFVRDNLKAAGETIKNTITDPTQLRNQLFQRLLSIRPKGKKILAWHAKTRASLKKSERLMVDGKRIPEYKFVQLLASWKAGTHPRKIDDYLRLIDTLTKREFCNYLALKWNNVIGQQIENNLGWLKINKSNLSDDSWVKSKIKNAKKKAKEAAKKTADVVREQSDIFSTNIHKKTEELERKNFIQGGL